MARPLRITIANLPFHVIDRGNNKQTIFYEDEDFIYFLKLLKRYKKELKFKLYHFCLMPNHIHLMIEPTTEGSLSKAMMRLTLAYSSYFNKKYKGVGHVWQGRYKSSLIDKDDYFVRCGLYVELNPVRAELVEKPEDWQWSSYAFYVSDKAVPLVETIIDIDPYFLELGETVREQQERYQENVNEVIKEETLNKIRKQLDEGIFGRMEFVRKMKEKFKVGSSKPRGRPRIREK